MADRHSASKRLVSAVHGLRQIEPDPEFEIAFANYLRTFGRDRLVDVYARFATGDCELDKLMRRLVWRSMARRFGHGVQIGSGVDFKHLETVEIGNGVFVGTQTYIQGRFDGRCIIGDHVWIGPQSYFDARDLIIEDYVGWGPGAKVLGSMHTGLPFELPIIKTDLVISQVTIETGADIGTNAVVLPGVRVGKGSIIGAGAIVTRDVPPFSIVAGVPARFLRWRDGYTGPEGKET
jgi:acetyltransferase-like isoleucine patch superfamily enzyme